MATRFHRLRMERHRVGDANRPEMLLSLQYLPRSTPTFNHRQAAQRQPRHKQETECRPIPFGGAVRCISTLRSLEDAAVFSPEEVRSNFVMG